jgi:hypothetical protein
MNRIRQLHLYLGCVFAPLLVFFAVSGAWQTFDLHRSRKDGSYSAPPILVRLSHVHQDQSLPPGGSLPHHSTPFRWFVFLMALGFVATAILGVVMAFKFTRERWVVWLCLGVGLILPVLLLYIGGGITGAIPQPTPTTAIHKPTTATMRALAERIANGDQSAFEELRDTATELYRDIDFNKERERVLSNLVLMRAAFNVLGEQAAKGNDKSFQALKTCLGTSNHLSPFAPDALGLAAAAGNTEALEILLHHDRWGIILSSTVFALRPAAENNDERAVDFLIGVIENPSDRPLWHGASEGLAGAAMKGNPKAKAALEKYEAANQN